MPGHAPARSPAFLPVVLSFAAFLLSFLLIDIAPASARDAASCPSATVVMRAAKDFMRAGRVGSAAAMAGALRRHVHMRRVMMFALGRNARKLSPAQEAIYMKRATRYAARQLARMGSSVRGGKVKVLSCRKGKVVTRIGPNKVTWKVRGGRVVDVKFRGMWVAHLLRDHFRRLMRASNNNVETFLARLN